MEFYPILASVIFKGFFSCFCVFFRYYSNLVEKVLKTFFLKLKHNLIELVMSWDRVEL